MRFFVVIAAGFILAQILSCSLAQEEADAEETDVEMEEPERTCKKYIENIVQGFLNAGLSCFGGKFQMQSIFDIGKRFYCLFRCVLQELGVLGANGRLDEVQALFFFQESIPEIILDVVVADAQPCLEMASGFDPSQYYCQSYGPFVQCVFNSLIRTMGPYALNCYATPGLGFFFSFINFIVPQATPATSAANAKEIKKRYREAQLRYNNQTARQLKKGTKGVRSRIQKPGSSKSFGMPGNFTLPKFKPVPNN